MCKRTIGEFLAYLRKRKGITQQQAADLLGVSNRTVSSWETDKAYPDILILADIAKLYGATADEIISGGSVGSDAEPAGAAQRPVTAEDKAAYRRALSRAAYGNVFVTAAGISGGGTACGIALTGAIVPLPLWAAVLFPVIAVLLMFTACVLAAAFYKKTLSSADVFPRAGELTQMQKNFAIAASAGSLRALFICGAVWLATGMLIFAVTAAVNSHAYANITGGAYEFNAFDWQSIVVPVTAGIAALCTSRTAFSSQAKKYGSEEKREVQKYNDLLLLKCSAPAACPIIALTVLIFLDAAWMVKDNVIFIVAGLVAIAAVIAIASFFYYKKRRVFTLNL